MLLRYDKFDIRFIDPCETRTEWGIMNFNVNDFMLTDEERLLLKNLPEKLKMIEVDEGRMLVAD